MKKIVILIGIIIFITIGFNLSSCTSTKTVTSNVSDDTQNIALGAQLWSNNCIRCHNLPSPSAYNDKEWSAITNHMQKVAGLTVSDADKILAFMKSAN